MSRKRLSNSINKPDTNKVYNAIIVGTRINKSIILFNLIRDLMHLYDLELLSHKKYCTKDFLLP